MSEVDQDEPSWVSYASIRYPDREPCDYTVWEIGEWPLLDVYPQAIQYEPRFMNSIEEANVTHLPHSHFIFFKVAQINICIWSCTYCSFWCDIPDQRIMENHLIFYCQNVCL